MYATFSIKDRGRKCQKINNNSDNLDKMHYYNSGSRTKFIFRKLIILIVSSSHALFVKLRNNCSDRYTFSTAAIKSFCVDVVCCCAITSTIIIFLLQHLWCELNVSNISTDVYQLYKCLAVIVTDLAGNFTRSQIV